VYEHIGSLQPGRFPRITKFGAGTSTGVSQPAPTGRRKKICSPPALAALGAVGQVLQVWSQVWITREFIKK